MTVISIVPPEPKTARSSFPKLDLNPRQEATLRWMGGIGGLILLVLAIWIYSEPGRTFSLIPGAVGWIGIASIAFGLLYENKTRIW